MQENTRVYIFNFKEYHLLQVLQGQELGLHPRRIPSLKQGLPTWVSHSDFSPRLILQSFCAESLAGRHLIMMVLRDWFYHDPCFVTKETKGTESLDGFPKVTE